MIEKVYFLKHPMQPGEERELRVQAAEPINVQIRCFVKQPPPPRYRPCAECGSFTVQSNHPLLVRANIDTFGAHGGSLQVTILDADKHKMEFMLDVYPEISSTPTNTPSSSSPPTVGYA